MEHPSTTPLTPAAWLLLLRCQDKWLVHGVYDAPDNLELLRQHSDALRHENELRIVPDDPGLAVLHSGLRTHTPAWLTARDNWFHRYQSQLMPYLVSSRRAQVFTFSVGKLLDPFSTFKATPGGPCPLPHGTAWPMCGYCQTKMVMVGVLDFRQFDEVKVPQGSLVLHGCPECGFCADQETWSVNWLIEGEPVEIHGDSNVDVQIGRRWWATEYPTPDMKALDKLFRSSGSDPGERATYFNFSCLSDKVGGHPFWIQGEEEFKKDFPDSSYVYIGQMTGEDESLNFWDSPIVYLMHSPEIGRTIASVQSF